jgi:hypothetical protein
MTSRLRHPFLIFHIPTSNRIEQISYVDEFLRAAPHLKISRPKRYVRVPAFYARHRSLQKQTMQA